jgi:hypothetical protein
VEQAVVFRPLVVLPLLLLLPASCNKQGESLVISPNFIILKRLDGSEARNEAGIEEGGGGHGRVDEKIKGVEVKSKNNLVLVSGRRHAWSTSNRRKS